MDDKKGWGYDDKENPEPNTETATASIFALMDEFAKTVEIFTGFKQQFIEAGWSEDYAEQMVLQFLKTSAVTNQVKGQ